jgi:2-polyprenyl-3-methyl-5-hydroxy-6-metoxy-1,4-benzoquinol methylase
VQKVLKNPSYYSRMALSSIFTVSPSKIFHEVSDDEWYWLHTEGRRKRGVIRRLLPGMPSEDIQSQTVGTAGDKALEGGFAGYRLFKTLYEKHVGSLNDCRAILDFGCGWGRIIRFFLRDVNPENLWGIDCRPDLIQVCKETSKWCNFNVNNVLPPTSFLENKFDLIYCFSVFSHLAENIHKQWLEEFSRILRPGGVFIATIWQREFVQWCDLLRQDSSVECEPRWRKQLALAFLDTQKVLRSYDAGEFCFSEYDRQAEPWAWLNDQPCYGEACISLGYIRNVWTSYLDYVEFVNDRELCPQNVVVMRKR